MGYGFQLSYTFSEGMQYLWPFVNKTIYKTAMENPPFLGDFPN